MHFCVPKVSHLKCFPFFSMIQNCFLYSFILCGLMASSFQQDIQKRLSLPVDIRLPQGVVDKLNRTPTLDNPLTRKSRRASLSEIGFGKLETYKKIFDLGEGTYATVWLGRSLLTGKSVALKVIHSFCWTLILLMYGCLGNETRTRRGSSVHCNKRSFVVAEFEACKCCYFA